MNQGLSGGVLAVAMLAGISCSTPKVDVAADAAAVRARSKACVTAEAEMDAEGAVAFYAEDAVVQPPGAPQLQGHEAILEMYRQFSDSGIKEFSGTTSKVTVSRSGELAYEYGVNRLLLPGPKGDLQNLGKYLLVWKKIDGEWFIAALSFTWDSPAPTPVEGQ
jgi:uncharacterized protein (TIGR02246 family)